MNTETRELTAVELDAIVGGRPAADSTQLMQAISDAMKKIQDTAKNAISNIR